MPQDFYERLGRGLVERAYGDTEAVEVPFEEIGRSVIHSGGPATAGDEAYAAVDERIARTEILPRIDEDLIAEHEDNPIGQHSDDLSRVVEYFRRQPLDDKYVIVETERSEQWCLGRLSEQRGEKITVTDDCYDSPEAAEHAIFKNRVRDLRERFEEAER